MKAKGHDWAISVLKDGRQIAAFRNFTSVDIDFGLGVEVHHYVGAKRPSVNGINNEATLSLPFEPDSAEYLELLDFQRRKNLPNSERQNIRIDASASVDFADGGRSRVLFSDCTLHDARLAVSGRVDANTNSSPTLTASEWKKL